MSNIYIARLTVPDTAIDTNRHVNNLAYLHWMQGLFIEHGLESGCAIRDLKQYGRTWAMVSHSIDYRAYAREGDDIAIFSWVGRLGEKSLDRRFLFYRIGDDTILAEAGTTFVYVDIDSGKGKLLPDELRAICAVTEEGYPLLRALRAETRDVDVIAQAVSSARPMSEASVNSLNVHKALLPTERAKA